MMKMEELISLLRSGAYSAVIVNGDDLRCFTRHGVADLHSLAHLEPAFLRGAMVADKVVGKGAAALMVSCGVRALYTHVISEGALRLLSTSGVEVAYGESVEHIINRSGDGWCPVEWLCREVNSTEEVLPLVDEFMNSIKI